MTIPVNEMVKFVNEHSQLVLEIEGEATTEGTRAEQYTDTGRDHQRWRLKPAGPGNEDFYHIENVHSTMSLEVVGSSTAPERKSSSDPMVMAHSIASGNWSRCPGKQMYTKSRTGTVA